MNSAAFVRLGQMSRHMTPGNEENRAGSGDSDGSRNNGRAAQSLQWMFHTVPAATASASQK